MSLQHKNKIFHKPNRSLLQNYEKAIQPHFCKLTWALRNAGIKFHLRHEFWAGAGPVMMSRMSNFHIFFLSKSKSIQQCPVQDTFLGSGQHSLLNDVKLFLIYNIHVLLFSNLVSM